MMFWNVAVVGDSPRCLCVWLLHFTPESPGATDRDGALAEIGEPLARTGRTSAFDVRSSHVARFVFSDSMVVNRSRP